MADFTTALYLGYTHPAGSLRAWSSLTTGRPAALGSADPAPEVAARLARRIGTESALLSRSTLHAVADCLEAWAGSGAAVLVDAGSYPIAVWAAQREAGRGTPVVPVRHHDPADLGERLTGVRGRGLRPVVVADGLCGGCGRPLPLRMYADAVRRHGGLLVVDDTQAVGLLGSRPTNDAPYGRGGGGTARWSGAGGEELIVVASLAKAFGAPLAVVAGARAVLEPIATAGSQVHASPPSAADLAAAERALDVDDRVGDRLRSRLAALVRRFRRGLVRLGLRSVGGLLPVQGLPALPRRDAARLHRRLAECGVRTVLRAGRCGEGVSVAFVLTARHTVPDVDGALAAVARHWPGAR